MRDRVTRDSGTQSLRGLKALVIVLGILVVAGTALVIGVVIKRMMVSTGGPAQQTSATPVAATPSGQPFTAVLPGGAGNRVAGVAAANGMIAIWVANDAGGKVVFIDPRTGRIAGTAAPGH